jgi:hypothetical protein
MELARDRDRKRLTQFFGIALPVLEVLESTHHRPANNATHGSVGQQFAQQQQ